MKKIALLALFAGSFAFGQTKKVFSSDLHWWGYKVAKTEASSHDGTVALKSGTIMMKGNSLVGGTFVMDMTSINATDITGERQAKLNEHLKNGDFFEVEKYPTAVYKITSVKKNSGKSGYTVHGNLTVKGKTHAVDFPAKITIDKSGVVSLVSEKFSWDRQKFDVAYKSSMKDVVIRDEVEMTLKVQAK